MPNTIFKTLLYVSSYFPLAIMIYLDNMKKLNLKEVKRVFAMNSIFWVIVIVLLVLSSIALVIWLYSMKNEASSDGKKYRLDQLKSNDGEIMNYFVSYIIPLLSLEIQSITSILMNLVSIIVIGIYFVRNNTLHYNVILLVLGYHVYSDFLDNIVISRRKLHEITNNALKADQIGTSNIFYI